MCQVIEYKICDECSAMVLDEFIWITKNGEWIRDSNGERISKSHLEIHKDWHREIKKELK